ncbi:MAG: hypothetical protein ACI4RR_04310 [Eubacterium sp.]
MNDEKGRNKRHKHKNHKITNAALEYTVKNSVHLIIALAVIIPAVFLLLNPVTSIVHKAEEQMPRAVRDVEIEPSAEPADISNPELIEYGSYVADIVCEKKGINTPFYYGLNRVSMRYGAGLSGNGAVFDDSEKTIVAGWDEECFSALKLVEKGDIFEVDTKDAKLKYVVKKAFFAESTGDVDGKAGQLVLYSIFSDFSENSGKCFYVVADRVKEADSNG